MKVDLLMLRTFIHVARFKTMGDRIMTMPWGKYRGLPFNQIPHDYLIWVVDVCEYAKPTLKDEIRLYLYGTVRPRPFPPPEWSSMQQQLNKWYQELARDYKGVPGDTAAPMLIVNDVCMRLYQRLASTYGVPSSGTQSSSARHGSYQTRR